MLSSSPNQGITISNRFHFVISFQTLLYNIISISTYVRFEHIDCDVATCRSNPKHTFRYENHSCNATVRWRFSILFVGLNIEIRLTMQDKTEFFLQRLRNFFGLLPYIFWPAYTLKQQFFDSGTISLKPELH